MFKAEDFLTLPDKIFGWIFGVLFAPVGLIFWSISVIQNHSFKDINHWSILRPGFYFGLILSFIFVHPFLYLYAWTKLQTFNFSYKRSEQGKANEALIQQVMKIFEEIGMQIEEDLGFETRVSRVHDKWDKTTRVHLLYDNNHGNHMFSLHHEDGLIWYESRYSDIHNFDINEFKDRVLSRIEKNKKAE